MRLYLSSFDIGDDPAELVKLAPNGRVGIIMNALDNFPDARQSWQDAQTEKLVGLGFIVEPIDLRDHFGLASALDERLAQLDAVWINGGNTFVLRRAMALSGFDLAIKEALDNDRIVYAGFSAAAVVLHRSLRGLELVDDPNDVPDGYPTEVPWEGLNILPFSVVVHFASEHSESVGVSKEVDFYKANGIAFKTLKDGQALVIANGTPFIAP
jgi:dipeptidase E